MKVKAKAREAADIQRDFSNSSQILTQRGIGVLEPVTAHSSNETENFSDCPGVEVQPERRRGLGTTEDNDLAPERQSVFFSPFLKRVGVAFGLGGFITVGLLYFMAAIIAPPENMVLKSQDEMAIEFLRIKRDTNSRVKSRQRPKKPEVKPPPPLEKLQVAQNLAPKVPALKMNIPRLNQQMNFKGGGLVGVGSGVGGDAQVMPLVRIEPQFPRKAAMSGTEGWVLLSFDITPMGTVDNVKVLKSKPRRTFDSAARRALLKWKYKPKMIDGRPVDQMGMKVKIAFNLKG